MKDLPSDKKLFDKMMSRVLQAPTEDVPVGITMGIMDGLVILEFDHAVKWLGLHPDKASTLGEALINCAKEARK